MPSYVCMHYSEWGDRHILLKQTKILCIFAPRFTFALTTRAPSWNSKFYQTVKLSADNLRLFHADSNWEWWHLKYTTLCGHGGKIILSFSWLDYRHSQNKITCLILHQSSYLPPSFTTYSSEMVKTARCLPRIRPYSVACGVALGWRNNKNLGMEWLAIAWDDD